MKALITGILGQDGLYLTEYLLRKGDQVMGVDLPKNAAGVRGITYQSGSLADKRLIADMLLKHRPDQVYNLGSISQVSLCYKQPEEAIKVNFQAVVAILEIIRHKLPNCRFLQASSSEMFSRQTVSPLNEGSLIEPVSFYGVTKAAAYQAIRIYRLDYGIFAANAILFNHTSPRHTPSFVIAKMINGLVAVKLGKEKKLKLGDLAVVRDWGYAGDYVKAMSLIIEAKQPDDYVIGTGKDISLKTILDYVLNKLNLSYNKVVEIDPELVRKNEQKNIYSDPTKIKKVLGWRPEKTIEQVLDMMIAAEMERQNGK
jgi:GDPmannose 4,6-dehydratase